MSFLLEWVGLSQGCGLGWAHRETTGEKNGFYHRRQLGKEEGGAPAVLRIEQYVQNKHPIVAAILEAKTLKSPGGERAPAVGQCRRKNKERLVEDRDLHQRQ